MFNAIMVNKAGDEYTATLANVEERDLPAGDVTVAVEYSTLNYKDALAITGRGPIVRRFPMVAGIDLAGTVLESTNHGYSVGQKVLVNGWGLGEDHWGGLAQRARVKADWLTPVPAPLSTRDAMSLGTAGFTAMLCVQALEHQGVTPEQGDVLVTGATGGVGSVAVHLLGKRGYRVIACTGHGSEKNYLLQLGAADVIDRAELDKPGQPLGKQRWAGAVDVAGSHTLANICASLRYGGVVAACGLAQGMDLPASVAPFILRGIRLIGINSVYCPVHERNAAWTALARDWHPDAFDDVVHTVGLAEAIPQARALMDNKIRGRILVDVNV